MLPLAKYDQQSISADPRSLDRLRASMATNKAAATQGAAQQFEALLLQQMLTSMRNASPKNELDQSPAIETFKGMRDQQLAQNWAQSGGIGFAKLIERQLSVLENPALLQQPLRRDVNRVPTKPLSLNAAAVAAKPAADVATVAANVAPKGDGVTDFVSKLGQAAQATAQTLGVSPHVLLAHAALETGWGKKGIKDSNGNESFNLFGIKAGSQWQGKTVDVLTTEYVDGVAQKRIEKFRAYDSYADSMADYASLVKRRFSGALSQGNDVVGFAKALVAGGYATDPQYVQKLTKVAERVADQLISANSRTGA
ncbi:flagellar assembly peptidoglycan hydrolase FlgJ [Chitinibacter bivalviorum]|uniref:Peptidoglycan hydrolase FlgJ n=1 Tax=Chitinibacter bivalviorum TaxID=2739434 RepID=A0A7H9BIF6_9NEIS|nr:flagellar assembly peptidoglycan hydrolase FlgJ [Chitinibacter bivalviorum]QLG88132.1 flagellar assembly peptidoglycan hydrolase FlgJ [Chitinibacter bivalviorum]